MKWHGSVGDGKSVSVKYVQHTLGNEEKDEMIRSQIIKDVKISSELCKQENDQMIRSWGIEESTEGEISRRRS